MIGRHAVTFPDSGRQLGWHLKSEVIGLLCFLSTSKIFRFWFWRWSRVLYLALITDRLVDAEGRL